MALRDIGAAAPSFAFALRRLRRIAKALARRRADRRAHRCLLSFSDRELRDIGLTRDDLYRILSKPLDWRDP